VPFRLDVCGLLLALSLTDSDPSVAPVPVGLKTTLIVHFVFFARLLPQVVVETANTPLVEMLMLFKVTFRSFVKVNVLGALVVPTFVLANVALAGASFA
jgi:hypothetical protein